MYFDSFPVIPYDAKGNLEYKDVTNLLRRVGLRAKVRSNTLLYDTYDVKEGETPEIIAHKLYGDAELHWVILLVNDIIDIIIDGLKLNKKVKIHNFGTFKLNKKKSRIGRNPKTKEEFNISSRNVITFKASKILLKYINNNIND